MREGEVEREREREREREKERERQREREREDRRIEMHDFYRLVPVILVNYLATSCPLRNLSHSSCRSCTPFTAAFRAQIMVLLKFFDQFRCS